MGIVIRQSAVSTALSYTGVLIGYVNLLILFPRYMSPEEVGLARIIQDAAMLMVPFAQLGTNQLLVRYFPEHKNKSQYGEFIGLIFSLLTITLVLFVLLFFVFKSSFINYFSAQAPEVPQYLNYILGLTLILAIYQVMVAFSQSSLNIVLPNFLKEVLLRTITLIGIILFAAQAISFLQFISLLIGAYSLNLFILIIYLAQKGVLKIQLKRTYFNTALIKKMLTFMLFTFLGASGILIIGKIDSLMVAGMLGLKETAIYTTAFYIAVLIELPKRAVSQISLPIISRAFQEENISEVKYIYSKSAINNLIIASSNIGKGNLDIKVPEIKTDKDMEVLNQNFNLMIDKLKSQQEKLIIKERHEAWENLARKLAHEIKNPLAPIQLTIDRLKSKYSEKIEDHEKDDFSKSLLIIGKQIKQIENLVNEFSDFARMPKPILKNNNLVSLIKDNIKLINELDIKIIIDFNIKNNPKVIILL